MSVCVCCVLPSAQALSSRVWFCLLYWAPITYLYTLTRSLFNLLSSRLTKTSSPFLTGELLQSLHHSVGSSLDSLRYVHISLALRSPIQDTALQVSPVWSGGSCEPALPQGHIISSRAIWCPLGPQVLSYQDAFQLSGPQHIPVCGLVPLQVQDWGYPNFTRFLPTHFPSLLRSLWMAS